MSQGTIQDENKGNKLSFKTFLSTTFLRTFKVSHGMCCIIINISPCTTLDSSLAPAHEQKFDFFNSSTRFKQFSSDSEFFLLKSLWGVMNLKFNINRKTPIPLTQGQVPFSDFFVLYLKFKQNPSLFRQSTW